MSEADIDQISGIITLYNLVKNFGGTPSQWKDEDYADIMRLLAVEGIIQDDAKRKQKKREAKAKARSKGKGKKRFFGRGKK